MTPAPELPRTAAILALAALAACSAGAPPPPSPVPLPAATAVSSAPSAPPAASASASSAAAAPAPDPYGGAPSPFALLARGDERRFAVHLLDDTTLVSADLTLGELRGGEVVFDPRLREGLPPEARMFAPIISHVVGALPRAAFLTLSQWTDYGSTGTLYARGGDQWVLKKELPMGSDYLGLVRWGKGRLLALIHGKDGDRFELLEGSGPLPRGGFDRGHSAQYLEATPAGELVAASLVFPDERRVTAACTRWSARGDRLGDAVLPDHPDSAGVPNLVPTGIYARSAREIYVYGGAAHRGEGIEVERGYFFPGDRALGYLARFDGARWTFVPTPAKSTITAVIGADDGGIIVASDKLRRMAADGTWSDLPTPVWSSPDAAPSRLAPVRLARRAPGEILLLGRFEGEPYPAGIARLSSGGAPPPKEPVVLAAAEDAPPAPGAAAAAAPRVDCSKPFVQLFTLAPRTPADFDFPSTRAALKGHKELFGLELVETEEDGKRRFGAVMPDRAAAGRLMALIRAKIPSATPQLLCSTPRVKRVVRIDLATGDVLR